MKKNNLERKKGAVFKVKMRAAYYTQPGQVQSVMKLTQCWYSELLHAPRFSAGNRRAVL